MVNNRNTYPLMSTQSGVYFESLRYPDSTIYNIPCIYRLDDSIDMELLSNAISRAIMAHPCLTATIQREDDEIVAVRNKGISFSFPVEKVLPKTEDLVRPFDLMSEDPLFRIRLFDSPEGKYLFLDTHHIISDGTSISILLEDISKAYEGKPVETEEYSGFDKAVDEKKARSSKMYEEAHKWYDSIYKGCDSVTLPLPENTGSKETIAFDKRKELNAGKVREFCQKNNISLNAFFTGTFGFTLKAYTGNENALFTTIYNGRLDTRLDRSVSMFVKTLPVMIEYKPDLSVTDFLRQCQSYLGNAMINDIVSFEEIHNAYGISADVLFAFQGDQTDGPVLCGKKAKEVELESSQTKAPFGLDISLCQETVRYEFEYDPAFYSKYTIDGFFKMLANVVNDFLEKEYLADISLTSGDDEKRIGNLYDTAFPVAERPAYRLLQDSADKYPDRTAVVAVDRTLSYSALNTEANCVGNVLISEGAVCEMIVAVIADRNSLAYVMRQGVLKSGAAFLPIDPEYPDDRIDFILEDSGAEIVVTDADIPARRRDLFDRMKKRGITVITAQEAILSGEGKNPNVSVPYEALAYVIYTSGSTGRPKGVMITGKNLVNFVDDNVKNREIRGYTSRGHVSLAIAALTFDFSIMEEFVPIANGMTVVLAGKEEIMDPVRISDLMTKNNVDVMSCTPGYIMNMLDMDVFINAVKGLRSIDLGAEAFPLALYEKLTSINPDIYIMNGYGPTEATISCTMQVIEGAGAITIGIPNANVSAATVDREGRLQIPGAMGELVILGDGVGRGYIGRDDLTAKSFVTLLGQRAYKTGDLVRILSDGQIEYHGRIDNQVKLRGLRVELGEIESVLNSYPGIKSSIVVVVKGETEYLAAYFTADLRADIGVLKRHLSSRLTSYMVPQVFLQLEEMPLTANGKIDKKALPEIQEMTRERKIRHPETATQEVLLSLFKETLEIKEISIDESFFELGGTSLTAARLLMAAMTRDIPIVFQDIFDYPTVEALASLVDEKAAEQTDSLSGISYQTQEDQPQKPGNINKALKFNTAEHVDELSGSVPGNVLITGVCGFLGIHVLRELMQTTQSTIYCLVHSAQEKAPAKLRSAYYYYFNEWDDEKAADRIIVLSGDITNQDCLEGLDDLIFDTVFNCAACVKHFAEEDYLMHVNLHGVDNLIDLCCRHKARLVQMSTVSVAGEMVGRNTEVQILSEDKLSIGQEVESNAYVYSKYLAEKHILEAVADKGLDAKIIRLGNLMSRHEDGEFQINFHTNNFMNTLKSYVVLGCFPIQYMDDDDELSPIDEVARAVVLLSGTESKYTVFHAYNSHSIEMGDIIYAMKDYGFHIDLVEESDFKIRLKELLADKEKSQYLLPLVGYDLEDDALRDPNEVSNAFTIKALYRLGFKWSIVDTDYIETCIEMLDTLGFFDIS